jgi:hypothetical protein
VFCAFEIIKVLADTRFGISKTSKLVKMFKKLQHLKKIIALFIANFRMEKKLCSFTRTGGIKDFILTDFSQKNQFLTFF